MSQDTVLEKDRRKFPEPIPPGTDALICLRDSTTPVMCPIVADLVNDIEFLHDGKRKRGFKSQVAGLMLPLE